jgi:hypothetical protein
MSIKVLIFGVKSRDNDIGDSHPSYGAMSAERLNKDCGQRLHRYQFAVKLNRAISIKNKVYLGQFFVIMHPCIIRNLNYMQRCYGIIRTYEGPLGIAAGAALDIYFIEMRYHVICHILLPKKSIEFSVVFMYILPINGNLINM